MKRPRPGRAARPGPPLLPRVFAVLAAVLLVGSVALASLLPADTSLGQTVRGLDGSALDRLQHLLGGPVGHTVWSAVLVPILVRPVWLVPVCLGLICVGGAVTALSHAAPRPKQRRS